ncbi:MAG: hypothetical protein AABX31_01330 [Nanoarchaeota archaeon]
MKLENIVKTGIFSALVSASTDVYAQAQKATPEQIIELKRIQNTATDVKNRDNDIDWYHQEKLIDSGKATVLIEPVSGQAGYCFMGLDGFPQKYDLPADEREKDGELRKAEMILNLSEKDPAKKFYFPCDLKAPETLTNPDPLVVPGPKTTKNPWKNGKLGVGIGPQIMGTAKDEATQSYGTLHGASIQLTYTPSEKKLPWLGVALSGVGNWSGIDQDLEVPAADGPLAGKLVMKGKDEYRLQIIGLGLGFIVGGEIYANDKNTFGFGLETNSGIVYEWATHKFGESSAQFINGNLVEGTDISNHSDVVEKNISLYNQLGARLRFGDFCLTPLGGLKLNLSNLKPYGMGGWNLGYCPRQE